MRLYTMYYLCKVKREVFLNVNGKQTAPNKDEYEVDKWADIRKGIDDLYGIESLRVYLDNVYHFVPTPYKYLDFIVFDRSNLAIFKNNIERLNIVINTIITLYESLGYEESENNLEIRLPEGLGLNEMSKLTDDLNFVFQQSPFIEREQGNGKILKTDVGSIWLVLIGSSVFLTSVGYMVSTVTKARADFIALRQSEAMLGEMKVKEEILEDIKKGFKEQKNIIMEKYISELSEKTGKELVNGEDKGKAVACLERLDKWIDRGMQIYASIDTPREIQILFPDQPELKLLNKNEMKYIEAKKTDKQ